MIKNPKVTGAFLIGFALVAASYVLSNFGENPTILPAGTMYVTAAEAEPRVYIEVDDIDKNGIEDWREEFVTTEPILLPVVSSTTKFEVPDTITEQIGVQFFESILRAKGSEGIGPTEAEVIDGMAKRLEATAGDVLFGPNDIAVIPSSPEAIRTYANTIAQIILNNNVPNYENELVIMNNAMQRQDSTELEKLEPLIAMYRALRDQTLATPVPEPFVKEHLDLINVYQALFKSLNDMQLAFSDPVVALMRIQRYQDDATGLANALLNMYTVLMPHARLFTADDPAVLFVNFAPNYNL